MDHPSDSNRGGVCIWYKEHIPLIERDNTCILDNFLVTEICSKCEKYFSTCIYNHPNQSHDEFETFCVHFNLLLNDVNQFTMNYKFPIGSIVT